MNNLVPLGAVVHDRADNLQLGLHPPWLPKPRGGAGRPLYVSKFVIKRGEKAAWLFGERPERASA